MELDFCRNTHAKEHFLRFYALRHQFALLLGSPPNDPYCSWSSSALVAAQKPDRAENAHMESNLSGLRFVFPHKNPEKRVRHVGWERDCYPRVFGQIIAKRSAPAVCVQVGKFQLY